MAKNIYSYLDTLTDEYVPNKFDAIMNQIDTTEPITLKAIPSKKHTHSVAWKYTIAAACFCAIIISAAIWNPNSNVSTSENNTMQSTSNSATINPVQNFICWNTVEQTSPNRLAIDFQTTDRETWISKFPMKIPDAINYQWKLGYDIDKELGVTQDLKMGYFSCDVNNVGYLTVQAIQSAELSLDETSTLLYFCTSSDEFKMSQISEHQVFLGSDGQKLYAAFNDGNHSFYLTLESAQKNDFINVLDSILK